MNKIIKIILIFLCIIPCSINCNENNNDRKELDKISQDIITDPNYAWKYSYRGQILFRTKQYDEAFEDFQTVNSIKEDTAAYYFIAAIYLKRDNIKEAFQNINKAISLYPINSSPYRHEYGLRGICNDLLNNKKQALEDYLHFPMASYFTKEKGRCFIVFVRRGMIYYQDKKYDYACDQASFALELDDSIADLYYLRFLCYNKLKKYEKAKENIKKAFKKGFNDEKKLNEDISSEENAYKIEIEKIKDKYMKKKAKVKENILNNQKFIVDKYFDIDKGEM